MAANHQLHTKANLSQKSVTYAVSAKSPKASKSLATVDPLQRAIGNQGILRSHNTAPKVQSDLKIGESDDRPEQEADHRVDHVMRMSLPGRPNDDSISSFNNGPENLQRSAYHGHIQRKCIACNINEEEVVQRKQNSKPGNLASHISYSPSVYASDSPEISNRNVNRPSNTLKPTMSEQGLKGLFANTFIQAKLKIGAPNDKYEQEADRVADQVMRMPESTVQRQSDKEGEGIQTKPLAGQITPLVQRQDIPEEEEEETLQTKANSPQTPTVTPGLHTRINALSGSGQPLSPSTRAFFEPRLGRDLSQVRVHTGSSASETARAINAKAYTLGRDIVFGAGQHQPQTTEGKRLLAHELVHVGQQNTGASQNIQHTSSLGDGIYIQRKEPKDTPSVVDGGVSVEEQQRNKVDVYAGTFIGLRAVVDTFRDEVNTTKARKLVWKERRLFGSHSVDWNPALNYLTDVVSDIHAWLSGALEEATTAYSETDFVEQTLAVTLLESELERIARTIQLVGMYLAAIRVAQYALHDAPGYVIGELGFNEGIIDRTNDIYALLEQLRGGASAVKLASEIDAAISSTQSYTQRFYDGLKDGAKLLKLAQVIGVITAVFGVGQALIAISRLLASGFSAGGGMALAGATAGGGTRIIAGTSGAVSAAEIELILQGARLAAGGGTVALMTGGIEPVETGKAGEEAAGITGSKERIPSLTKTAKYRVPDKLTKVTLKEVKNVTKLSNTRQLRDFLLFAQKTGRTFTLIIRKTTTLSKPLLDLVDAGLISLRYLP